MVPWAHVLDNLHEMIRKTKEGGGLDPISMHELSAMGDYNLARSKNIYGSLKNAYDQRATKQREVPSHMMPDYMTWMRAAYPAVYQNLYGPAPETKQTFTPQAQPEPRKRDARGFAERRAHRAPQQTAAPPPKPPKQTAAPPKPPKQTAAPPPKQTNPCQTLRDECAAMGKSGRACFKALAHKHHPDKGGDGEKMKQVNNCKDKL